MMTELTDLVHIHTYFLCWKSYLFEMCVSIELHSILPLNQAAATFWWWWLKKKLLLVAKIWVVLFVLIMLSVVVYFTEISIFNIFLRNSEQRAFIDKCKITSASHLTKSFIPAPLPHSPTPHDNNYLPAGNWVWSVWTSLILSGQFNCLLVQGLVLQGLVWLQHKASMTVLCASWSLQFATLNMLVMHHIYCYSLHFSSHWGP